MSHDPFQIVDEICDRFEQARRNGDESPMEAWLPAANDLRPVVLTELVRVELQLRLASGVAARAEDYLDRFPELQSNPELALQVVAAEFRQRRRTETTIAPIEYRKRFPHLTELSGWVAAFGETDRTPESTGPKGAVDTGPWPQSAGSVATPAGYELVHEAGRGGMGVVYRAQDTSLGRPVAIKFLQPALAGDPRAIARFLAEARVTAGLQHPGIPPVHQMGLLPDGRPYLAMKLIHGETLAARLKARQCPAEDRGQLLAVFERVCETVGYAHAERVIHRDLKPQNVMVGAFGEVQVMDWGLAKNLKDAGGESAAAADDASAGPDMTRPGSVLGTPAYMAPEQAAGIEAVDERADVFGLGAILCAILTGRPPYTGSDAKAVGQAAAVGDLGAAFTRLDGSGAEPELVALCKRCLSFRPTDRPRDGAEVARAIAELRTAAEERAREAERERARLEGERAKAEVAAREQRKRRRTQIVLCAAVFLLLAGGSGFAWWRVSLATGNAEAITALLTSCEQSLRAGEVSAAATTLDEIERRVQNAGGDAFQDRLVARQRDLEFLKDLREVDRFRWTCSEGYRPPVKAVVERWRAALRRFGADPVETSIEDTVRRVRGSAIHSQLIVTLDQWHRKAKEDEQPLVREVLRRIDPDLFREAVRDTYETAEWAAALTALAGRSEALAQPSWFVAFLGESRLLDGGRRRALLAAALLRQPGDLDLLMTLANTYPSEERASVEERIRWYQSAVAAHPEVGVVHANLGLVLEEKGDADGAIAEYREALRLEPNWAPGHNFLGNALYDKKDLDGAIAEYKEAIRLDSSLPFPHTNLGNVLLDKGDVQGAIAAHREAIRLNPQAALPHNNLAILFRIQKDLKGAASEFREAVRLEPTDASLRSKLANALIDLGDLSEAIAELRECVRLSPLPINYNRLGNALGDNKDMEGALQAYREAARLDPMIVFAHLNLAETLSQKGDTDGAIKSYRQALGADPTRSDIWFKLGNLLLAKGEFDEAAAAFKEAIRLNPKSENAHNNLGVAFARMGDQDRALVAYRELLLVNPRYALAHNNVGLALRATGDLDGAIRSLREAVRLEPARSGFLYNLGVSLRMKGDMEGAIGALTEAVRIAPTYEAAILELARTLDQTSDLKGAIACYKDVVRLNPKSAEAANALAWLLAVGPADLRDGSQSVVLAMRACELSGWKEPGYLGTLAAAQAEAGRFDLAVEYQTRVLSFAAYDQSGEARERLAMYARNQPYRQPARPPNAIAPRPREKSR